VAYMMASARETGEQLVLRARALHEEMLARGAVFVSCDNPACRTVWENHVLPAGAGYACLGCGLTLTAEAYPRA
jgi:hypothetical protein